MRSQLALGLGLTAVFAMNTLAAVEEVVIYHCTDPQGEVVLRDTPCPEGDTQRERRYEVDQIPTPVPAPEVDEASEPEDDTGPGQSLPLPVEPTAQTTARQAAPPIEVPPLFECTTFEDERVITESDAGNRRCVPLQITRMGAAPPAEAFACEWVVDDCHVLPPERACDGWRTLHRDAVRAEREAFSDTVEQERRSLERLRDIRDAACAR